jgi:hypothetical protein
VFVMGVIRVHRMSGYKEIQHISLHLYAFSSSYFSIKSIYFPLLITSVSYVEVNKYSLRSEISVGDLV